MTPFDRQVRAQIYRLLVNGAPVVDAVTISASRGWDQPEVADALARLAAEHRVALVHGEERVWMAHPFSGVETDHRSVIGTRSWYANCAWDSLAILALLGDGTAISQGREFSVRDGRVSPDRLVHLQVPARHWWDDVGFT